jgi:hypothetical protein
MALDACGVMLTYATSQAFGFCAAKQHRTKHPLASLMTHSGSSKSMNTIDRGPPGHVGTRLAGKP